MINEPKERLSDEPDSPEPTQPVQPDTDQPIPVDPVPETPLPPSEPTPSTDQPQPIPQRTTSPDSTKAVFTQTSQPDGPTQPQEPAQPPRKEEVLADHQLSQVLKINVGQIDFGELLPGQIVEENLIIMNTLASTKVPFKIKVNCLTKEFDELDEYVYSMRRPNNNDTYNYNDTFLILLTAKSVSYYKVAIKVPNVKEETEIVGSIDLVSNECPGVISIPIRARVFIPIIKCEKMITLKSLGLPVVKLYMKTPKRQDFRINLKNMCRMNLIAELFILKNDDEIKNMDFNFYPQNVNLPPNLPINFMMSAKCMSNEADILNKEIHCVLIVKIKNSSAIFSYPIVILIGDGKLEGKTMS